MSTHNIFFHGELTKIIFKLSSNIFLICSTGASENKWTDDGIEKLSQLLCQSNVTEHDKTNKLACALSSLSAWRSLWSLAIHKAHSEIWSDCEDAQADPSHRRMHRSFCWFCRALAQVWKLSTSSGNSTLSAACLTTCNRSSHNSHELRSWQL